jgi:hypothetical protein
MFFAFAPNPEITICIAADSAKLETLATLARGLALPLRR